MCVRSSSAVPADASGTRYDGSAYSGGSTQATDEAGATVSLLDVPNGPSSLGCHPF